MDADREEAARVAAAQPQEVVIASSFLSTCDFPSFTCHQITHHHYIKSLLLQTIRRIILPACFSRLSPVNLCV